MFMDIITIIGFLLLGILSTNNKTLCKLAFYSLIIGLPFVIAGILYMAASIAERSLAF